MFFSTQSLVSDTCCVYDQFTDIRLCEQILLKSLLSVSPILSLIPSRGSRQQRFALQGLTMCDYKSCFVDALDNGNNKKALQEADKALKKQKEWICPKVNIQFSVTFDQN